MTRACGNACRSAGQRDDSGRAESAPDTSGGGWNRHVASRAASSSAESPATGPSDRWCDRAVASWITTGRPSAERRTSHSKPSAPAASPRANAGMVFSGPSLAPPRCANTSGRFGGEDRRPGKPRARRHGVIIATMTKTASAHDARGPQGGGGPRRDRPPLGEGRSARQPDREAAGRRRGSSRASSATTKP